MWLEFLPEELHGVLPAAGPGGHPVHQQVPVPRAHEQLQVQVQVPVQMVR